METREIEKEPAVIAPNGKAETVAEKTPREIHPNTRRVMLIAAVLVVLAALIWGIKYFAYARSHQSTDDARIDASTVSVTSKISERVDSILVDPAQPVPKGQLLIPLDDRDERSRLDQAQAAVNAQRAQAAAAQSNVALTQQTVAAQATEGLGGITAAQSGISGAQANTDVARAGVTTAQAAVRSSSATAVMCQKKNVIAPTSIPKMPTKSKCAQRLCASASRTAPISAKTPSTKA